MVIRLMLQGFGVQSGFPLVDLSRFDRFDISMKRS